MSAWYSDGVRFGCTQCGHCCTGTAGYVWISPRDERAIAAHLGLGPGRFRERYTRLVGTMLALVDQPGGDCVFLTEDKRCAIHEVKPRQCLTYPFWPRLLATRQEFEESVECCPGVGDGPLFKPEEIEALLDRETPREMICRIFSNKRD